MSTIDSLTSGKKKELSFQFITNKEGDKVAVILPIAEFEELLTDLEDLTIIKERKDEPTISHEDLLKELKNDGILPD